MMQDRNKHKSLTTELSVGGRDVEPLILAQLRHRCIPVQLECLSQYQSGLSCIP